MPCFRIVRITVTMYVLVMIMIMRKPLVLVNNTRDLNRQSCCFGVTWLMIKRVLWQWGVIVLYEQLIECLQW